MDPSQWIQWSQSPSGSRAPDHWPEDNIHETFSSFNDVNTSSDWSINNAPQNPTVVSYATGDMDDEDYVFANVYGTDLAPGQLMSTKVPPAWNGHGSWFAFEENVMDWLDITVLSEEKHGPALKARMHGDAAIYKTELDRDKLKTKTGSEYFLTTIRQHYVKGVQNVFLYRLMQFMNMRRGRLDIKRWIAKFNLQRTRLRNAWMDLIDLTKLADHDQINHFRQLVSTHCNTNNIDVPDEATDEESKLGSNLLRS